MQPFWITLIDLDSFVFAFLLLVVLFEVKERIKSAMAAASCISGSLDGKRRCILWRNEFIEGTRCCKALCVCKCVMCYVCVSKSSLTINYKTTWKLEFRQTESEICFKVKWGSVFYLFCRIFKRFLLDFTLVELKANKKLTTALFIFILSYLLYLSNKLFYLIFRIYSMYAAYSLYSMYPIYSMYPMYSHTPMFLIYVSYIS